MVINKILGIFNRDSVIKKQIKKEKLVVYGAQAIKANTGTLFARPTVDYDLFSNTPKKSARNIEKALDKSKGSNHYYTKPAMHPGTWKVMSFGADKKKGTEDDIGVADLTKPITKPKVNKINGINYVKLSETAKDKRTSLADPMSAFRHEKDRMDLNRIKNYESMRRLGL